MKTVHEVCKLSGISVRTLHYYDEIGLLRPSRHTKAGYRLYDDAALARLQQILFFRELDFPLAQIGAILDSPSFDASEALKNHRRLLCLKRERLDRLIGLCDQTLEGDKNVSIQEFNAHEIQKAQERYRQQAKERWGHTKEYEESGRRAKGYTNGDWERIAREADGIFAAFAAQMQGDPAAPRAQDLVRRWQEHISRNYYDCTKEILAGLGALYLADSRFAETIDRHAAGTAAFMSEAIKIYCQ